MMTARRMHALITGLPPDDAATWRADKPGWTRQDELLASQTELLALVGRALIFWLQVTAAPHYKGLKPKDPGPLIQPIAHPDRNHGPARTPRRRGKAFTPSSARKFFGGSGIHVRR